MTTTYDPKLHKIVPIEPTREMADAGNAALFHDRCPVDCHAAMLSAAPEITLNQWQDISTAPRYTFEQSEEAKPYLIKAQHDYSGKVIHVAGVFLEDGFYMEDGSELSHNYTPKLWKPIDAPTPPEN